MKWGHSKGRSTQQEKKEHTLQPISTNENSKLTRSGQPLIRFVAVSGPNVVLCDTMKFENCWSTEVTQPLVSYYELLIVGNFQIKRELM